MQTTLSNIFVYKHRVYELVELYPDQQEQSKKVWMGISKPYGRKRVEYMALFRRKNGRGQLRCFSLTAR